MCGGLRFGSKCSHTIVYARNNDFFANPRLALIHFFEMVLIRRDFIAWSLTSVCAFASIVAAAPFWDVQCVGISPTIPPGASSAVVGRYAVLFFFDHRDTCARFHFNSLATDPHKLTPIKNLLIMSFSRWYPCLLIFSFSGMSVWVCGY